MKIKNTNPAFGDPGPFEVNSIDDLVSEMVPLFQRWALEDVPFDVMTLEIGPKEYVNAKVAETIEEFKAGLEVIK